MKVDPVPISLQQLLNETIYLEPLPQFATSLDGLKGATPASAVTEEAATTLTQFQDLFRKVAAASVRRRFTLASLNSLTPETCDYLRSAATTVELLEDLPLIAQAQRMCLPAAQRTPLSPDVTQYYNPFFILYHLQQCFAEVVLHYLKDPKPWEL